MINGRRFILLVFIIIAIVLVHHQVQQPANAAQRWQVTDELRQALLEYEEIPIIIVLDVPAHRALNFSEVSQAQLAPLVQEIARVGDGVLDRLAGQNISQIKRYDYFPLLAMIVDEAALETLAADKAVLEIALDVPVPPAMDDTIPLIGANNNHFLQYTGSGWSIAVLDTGVDKNHPSLSGRVVSEACYSSNVPSQGATSLCPGGAPSSTATNSALPCPVGVTGCDHGTHVADIAARVAPGAWLIPIQVFSRFTDSGSNTPCQNVNRTSPCTLSYTSDQVAALNRVWTLHIGGNNINVAAANMSLGGGFHTGPCDHLNEYSSLLLAINQLRSQNVATVIAAGNSGYRTAMAAPACLTQAISVAASDKSDLVASFSNISVFTTLLAPGTPILAAVPQAYTPIYQVKGGTSMAAPHVAGAIATFKEGQPTATVPQIITALTTNGPNITDQRSGGSVTKRRLSAWGALCSLISCDGDDFRTIGNNQTLFGQITPAGDVDNYYYFGTAGQRLTLYMNRTSGSHDPYLELFSPNGFRVAFNDNGGGGVNALINGYLLPQNGLFRIRARSVNNFTGNYQLISSTESVPLNPVPSISHLSPSWTAGTFFGSDFWVAIYGSNFMPDSQVRWNGQLRAKFYSSSTLIYIRVLGGDIGWPWPRNAFITVVNPTPGGGTSNSRAFLIQDPFLGESSLDYPESGSSVTVGESQMFEVSWIAPDEAGTWRDMQYMDMRLRNEQGEIAAWVRVVERANDDGGSYYRLLNAAEELVDEGLPGEDRDLVLDDIVTLHLADSGFSGSGLVAVMTPTLTFGPGAIGTYNVEFRVDTKSGEEGEPNVQEDVLGVFSIMPDACEVAISDVAISGALTGLVDETLVFTAENTPSNATLPVLYTWTPEPVSGQGTASATYQFAAAAEHIIEVQVENCGAFAAGVQTVLVSTGVDPDFSLTKTAPATAVADEPFTYTLTITNHGAQTATNLLIYDALPAGATYIDGGTLVGDQVQWQVDELEGYGSSVTVTYQVNATADLVNDDYGVSADGGYSAQSEAPVQTRLVDAQVLLTPIDDELLVYSGDSASSLLTFPGGAVFADTIITYVESGEPGELGDLPYAGRAFQLDAYQENNLLEDFNLYETIHITLDYDPADVMGLNLDKLALYFWQDGRWQGSGVTCTTDSNLHLVQCSLANPPAGQYALVESSNRLYLPLIVKDLAVLAFHANITGITIDGSQYAATFETFGFTPDVMDTHVHFFFDTVPPDQAGVPGSGPWIIYGGPSPFTGYGPADRPDGASQLCILVANHDHTVIQGSGNCYPLPE
jgi:uncharacterized repeat protein (TIGR01451 family)